MESKVPNKVGIYGIPPATVIKSKTQIVTLILASPIALQHLAAELCSHDWQFFFRLGINAWKMLIFG